MRPSSTNLSKTFQGARIMLDSTKDTVINPTQIADIYRSSQSK